MRPGQQLQAQRCPLPQVADRCWVGEPAEGEFVALCSGVDGGWGARWHSEGSDLMWLVAAAPVSHRCRQRLANLRCRAVGQTLLEVADALGAASGGAGLGARFVCLPPCPLRQGPACTDVPQLPSAWSWAGPRGLGK